MTTAYKRRASITRTSVVICFEGLDESGKTTTVNRIYQELQRIGVCHDTVRVFEPGSVWVGDKEVSPLGKTFRKLCFAAKSETARALLFEACRFETWDLVTSGFNNGRVILCDRGRLSTEGYQVAGAGIRTSVYREDYPQTTRGADKTFVLPGGSADYGTLEQRRRTEKFYDSVRPVFSPNLIGLGCRETVYQTVLRDTLAFLCTEGFIDRA